MNNHDDYSPLFGSESENHANQNQNLDDIESLKKSIERNKLLKKHKQFLNDMCEFDEKFGKNHPDFVNFAVFAKIMFPQQYQDFLKNSQISQKSSSDIELKDVMLNNKGKGKEKAKNSETTSLLDAEDESSLFFNIFLKISKIQKFTFSFRS